MDEKCAEWLEQTFFLAFPGVKKEIFRDLRRKYGLEFRGRTYADAWDELSSTYQQDRLAAIVGQETTTRLPKNELAEIRRLFWSDEIPQIDTIRRLDWRNWRSWVETEGGFIGGARTDWVVEWSVFANLWFQYLDAESPKQPKPAVPARPGAFVEGVDDLVSGWHGISSSIAKFVEEHSDRWIDVYRAQDASVEEHVNLERVHAEGGYGYRQVFELVQNGADAMLGAPGGKIEVLISHEAIYCANQGIPVTEDGVTAILGSYMSVKREDEIGRFGLGFKSVLAVTDRPEFYSRTGSFRFNGPESQQKIWDAVPSVRGQRTPVLRIAFPTDPASSAASDPNLAALMGWSDTIVKLPRIQTESSWLEADIKAFPAEFLIFSPHVGEVVLRDIASRIERTLKVRSKGPSVYIDNGAGDEEWRAFKITHTPSEDARADAGELQYRLELPVTWAVPLSGIPDRGSFWHFSPLEYTTSLSGIVNAPWKLSEDRKTFTDGTFNRELLDVVCQLVVDSLPDLKDQDDTGRGLDILPARVSDQQNWADGVLTTSIYRYAASTECIPDQNGDLRKPNEIKLHPQGLDTESLSRWARYAGRPKDWCHHSVETVNRRSRIERLKSGFSQGAEPVSRWLEALVVDRSVDSSAAAVLVAAAIVSSDQCSASQRAGIEAAQIILAEDGTWAPPKPSTVFMPPETGLVEADLVLVSKELLEFPGIREALNILGITEVDALSELQAFLATADVDAFTDAHWDRFWHLAREADRSEALPLIKDSLPTRVHFKTVSGRFNDLTRTLLPGGIVPTDGSRDATIAIDTIFHAREMDLIRDLGASSGPSKGHLDFSGAIYYAYRTAMRNLFVSRPGLHNHPNVGYLEFDPSPSLGPLEPLLWLSPEGLSRFTKAILDATDPVDAEWTMFHRSVNYPNMACPAISYWAINTYGRLETSHGYQPIHLAVAPTLTGWEAVLPVAVCSDAQSNRLGLPSSFSALNQVHRDRAIARAEELSDDTLIGKFYSELCQSDLEIPENIRCRVGENHVLRAPEEITPVWDQAVLNSYVPLEIPCLLAPNQTASNLLVKAWGLKAIDTGHIPNVIPEISGDSRPLAEMFPALAPFLEETGGPLELVPCSELRLEISVENAIVVHEKEFYVGKPKIYYLDSIEQDLLLDLITNDLGIRIGDDQRERILNQRLHLEQRERVLNVKLQKSREEKLLVAVGANAIRARLPDGLLPVAEQRKGRALSDVEVAKFAIDVWGVETLREFRAELEEAGLDPPTTFVGGKKERGWVRVLGFPREYAGFEKAQRDPSLEIEGPPNLHPLHPFQERSVANILSILDDESGNRGLLSLPTGAGKTRICVEALVRFAASRKLSGPILWVAQTDELCEQAVQSWSEIWRAFGPARERMQISRFWGPRDATPFLEGVHVVVATINKLQGCLYSEEYEWLDEVSCLVIDEAHSATTPSYSKLLAWQGLDRGHQRCPLIGLTATPYRGGTVQTESLVRRFQAQRLEVVDEFGSDVYAGLQERGVLARVEHGSLKGTTVTLSDEELRSIEALPENLRTMPAGVLARIRRSVGQDASRTELLLNSIKGHPEDWPILVFAASVEHAEIMSGLLNSEGVSAAAISERTNMAARRFYIQEFRAGRIRVLTNYGVLTAGFDAPQIRAVYVARPTYSRSLYQQMIGRGLRGPENGGKELCLIVNVEDNITNFGAQLAFTEFEYLWKTGPAWTADNSESSPTVANYGANWTDEENKIITDSYLSMLQKEIHGEEYVKTDSINEVMSQTGRTRGSVEFKYQNISAWLEQNRYKFIAGYKPAENYQASLGVVVEGYLRADTSGMLDLLRLEPTK